MLFSTWNEGDVFLQLAHTVAELKRVGVPRIIIMGPPPVWAGSLAKAAYDSFKADAQHHMPPMYSSFRLLRAYYDLKRDFRRHLPPGIEYVSTWDALCDDDKCRVWADRQGGELMQFDDVHFTLAGSAFLAQQIAPCLFPDGSQKPAFCQ